MLIWVFQIFPTILGHEFISITKESTYQIVFVSLMYLPPRRSLFWRAHHFMSGELVDRRERNNILRNVSFRGAVWKSWCQSRRESFHYSPFNVFRLLLGGLAYVLQKWCLWNDGCLPLCCRYPWRWWTRGVATDEFEKTFAPKFRISF